MPERLLVVLDLDETLIYATDEPLDREPDFRAGRYAVYRRPGLLTFLNGLSEFADISIWTASSPSYAASIVPTLFSESAAKPVFVFASDRCTRSYDPELQEHFTIKKLAKLKRRGFSLARVLHVDNKPSTFRANYGNGIRVSDYLGDRSDTELSALLSFIRELAPLDDVRPLEKRGWRRRLRSRAR